MAWIKMRAGLLRSPKVIVMSKRLYSDRWFRDWLFGHPNTDDTYLSDEALRCVTCALLLSVWSTAREYGKFIGDDLVIEHIDLADVDQMAGVTGFGEAMQSVGWLKTNGAVIFPNFKQYNAPMDSAEKQAAYRDRKKSVTGALPDDGNAALPNVTPRVEKRRVDKNKGASPLKPHTSLSRFGEVFELFWESYPRKVGKEAAFKAWQSAGKRLVVEGATRESAVSTLQKSCEAFAASPKGQGEFCPHPRTWLTQGRYLDDPAAWQETHSPNGQHERPGVDLEGIDLEAKRKEMFG